MNRLLAGFPAFFATLCLLSSIVVSADQPKTRWVKVTYYDYHSDRSNPEFEAPHQGAVRKGMVADTLDSEFKPVLGKSPYLNHYIHKWFRPFSSDFTAPQYYPRASYKTKTISDIKDYNEYGQKVEYLGIGFEAHDTSFANFVIYDSLKFELQDNGMYQFRDDNFFPLDNRGFKNEWNFHSPDSADTGDHNYSFTMELNWEFVMQKGLVFHFNGDDDVWVFINKKLALDLGGIHESTTDSIHLDSIEGLVEGETYRLDVFYAERHSSGSHLWITSNIFSIPSNLFIYGKSGVPNTTGNQPLGPSDSITVGVPFPLYAHVLDSLQRWKPEYDSLITWDISSTDGTLSTLKGSATVFTANTYSSTVTVTARFKDPKNDQISVKNIVFNVRPQPKHSDYIIKLYKEPGDITLLQPIGASDSVGYGLPYPVYGHVFDKSGAWLFELDSMLQWSITPESYGILDSKSGPQTLFTSTAEKAQVILTATLKNPLNEADSASCNVVLFVKEAPPPPQYIVNLYSSPDNLLSIIGDDDTIAIDFCDTIFGHVFDTSGQPLPLFDKQLVWSFSPDNVGILQPQIDSFTIFTATKFNNYVTVRATFNDPQNPGRFFVKKVVLFVKKAPDPYTIRLYKDPGAPIALHPLQDTITIIAGDSLNIYGHIFDTPSGNWLPQFDDLITWELISLDSAAILNPLQGSKTLFYSTLTGIHTLKAYFVDTVSKARPPSDKELFIKVLPGKPYSLQIQPDTGIQTVPFDTLYFGKNDKTAPLFATIRDKYGNFVSNAILATWETLDPNVASLSNLNGFTTTVSNEGKSVNQETMIIVSQLGLIPDTIIIKTAPKRLTAILPNPFKPGKDNIYDRLPVTAQDFYRNVLNNSPTPYVILIAVQSELPLVPIAPGPAGGLDSLRSSYGKVVAYDAVGNVVRRDLQLLRANENNVYSYAIVWDGRNENNRLVGTGTFLLTINGKMINGAPFKHTIKVGIKR